MVDAGAEAFSAWSGGCPMEFGDERTAAEAIFKAMVSAAKSVPISEEPA
jgi:hypothetical protein